MNRHLMNEPENSYMSLLSRLSLFTLTRGTQTKHHPGSHSPSSLLLLHDMRAVILAPHHFQLHPW